MMDSVKDRDLDDLRASAIRMGSLAQAILSKSLRGVWSYEERLVQEVKEDDLEIDRLDVEIDRTILRLLALRSPVAQDLRMVIATKSFATDLERVGDLARNIADCSARLSEYPEVSVPSALRDLAEDSERLLRQALDAYAELDADLGRRVISGDDRIDAGEKRVLTESLTRISDHPEAAEHAINCIFVASNLERVGDHATNIAEEVVMVTEAKNLKHATKLAT
jgi:phosphate transport system protein